MSAFAAVGLESLDILVVEDDPDTLEVMLDLLETEGYRVAGASDGRVALERLQEGAPPRLILLDAMMPQLSGQEFLARRARDPRLASVPVVVVSAAGGTASLPQGVPVVRKPVDLAQLLTVVAAQLALSHRRET